MNKSVAIFCIIVIVAVLPILSHNVSADLATSGNIEQNVGNGEIQMYVSSIQSFSSQTTKLVHVNVIFKNLSYKPQSFNLLFMSLIDNNGNSYNPELESKFTSVEIASMDTVDGEITFSLPATAIPTNFVYQTFGANPFSINLTQTQSPPDSSPQSGWIFEPNVGFDANDGFTELKINNENFIGNEYVVNVSIKNVGQDTIPYNPLYAYVKDTNGKVYSWSPFTDVANQLSSGNLSPGQSVSGDIAFDVGPASGTNLMFIWDSTLGSGSYFNTGKLENNVPSSNNQTPVQNTPPQYTSNFIASAQSSNEIHLSWNASPSVTAYNVMRSNTSQYGPFNAVATGISSTSYDDTELSASTMYYYDLYAINNGNSILIGTVSVATPSSSQNPILQSPNNEASNPQNSITTSQDTTNQPQKNQISSQTVSQNPEILDFSDYGLKKGEWIKYKIAVNVTAQNQYTELMMKSGLEQAAVNAFEQGNNITINSLSDLDWYKKTINDISKDNLSVNTSAEIRGQPSINFDDEGMQAGVPYSLAIPITTKIGDSLPTYDNSTSMPSNLIVTGISNDQVGGQNVESYELFGQKDSVDVDGIARENNVTGHYEKQTGMLLDSRLDGKYGSPTLGVADVHVYVTALDLFIPQNETTLQTTSTATQSVESIPSWIHNTAKWWSEGSVGDSDFVKGVQYLIQQKIITIPNTTQSNTQSTNQIPPWVKGIAGWWADGKISDSEFIRGIQFLVQAGIIKV